MIVDDVPTNRSILIALLKPLGFEIAEASNGAEALDIFGKWSPHAVLMDMRMPVMDGYEATHKLRYTDAGKTTPIIAVTASAFDDSKNQVMAAGVDAYLRKPFRSEELFAILGKCLGLNYIFSDEIDKQSSHPIPLFDAEKTLLALPKELIQSMRNAIDEGDMARLTELIAKVKILDATTALMLLELADRYDYEKLAIWLEKGEAAHE